MKDKEKIIVWFVFLGLLVSFIMQLNRMIICVVYADKYILGLPELTIACLVMTFVLLVYFLYQLIKKGDKK